MNNDKLGKSDPYVKVRYGKEEFRSQTISNNLNPKWNYVCSFDITEPKDDYIHINCYDDDFGKDNIQGCFSYHLGKAISEASGEPKWFDLIGCQSGSILISTSYRHIVLEDISTEKPMMEIEATPTAFKEAEKIVSGIVEKAEKVIYECEAQLQKDNNEPKESNQSITEEIDQPKASQTMTICIV